MKVFKITTVFLCCFMISFTLALANEDADSEVLSDNAEEAVLDHDMKEEVAETLDVLEDLYKDKNATIILTLPNNKSEADGVEEDSAEQLQSTCNGDSDSDKNSCGGDDAGGAEDEGLDIKTSPPDENGIQITIITNGQEGRLLHDDQEDVNGITSARRRSPKRYLLSTRCWQRRNPRCRTCGAVSLPGWAFVTSSLPSYKVAKIYCRYARAYVERLSHCCINARCAPCKVTLLRPKI